MGVDIKTNVIKRNGEEVLFDLSKIVNAVKAANGEVVYTYWTTDGKQLDAKPTAEGTYIMRATVHAFGYEDLVEDIEFTISPAWDETFLIIDTVLAVVAAIATIVVIAIVIRRKNRC